MDDDDPDDEFNYGNGNDDNNQWFTAAPSDEQELSEIGRVIIILFYVDWRANEGQGTRSC